MEYKISIITSSFNKDKFIEQTIESVLSQTWTNWELIIVDDCSTDSTPGIIKTIAHQNENIKLFINNENRGANYCRNFGLNKATGNYVIFLDADDLLLNTCLEQRVNAAAKNPLTGFLVFSLQVFNEKPGDDMRQWKPDTKDPLRDFLSHQLPWQTMQVLWRKELIIQLGGFDEEFKRLQDVELHTRALLTPDISYKIINGPPDCYFRVDETRKNFQTYNFLSRWVDSALLYCNKFSQRLPSNLIPLLLGTVFQTYLQLLYHKRIKKISWKEFENLEKHLLSSCAINELGLRRRKSLFALARFYNLYSIRIPGINWILQRLITF